MDEEQPRLATATFAAGCFWGVEASLRQVAGVKDTRVGYTGGTVQHPTYEEVCTGKTGHAEAVEVTYDPGTVSYEELLEVFWSIHDPTTPDRQGWNVGSQYRSAIFYHTREQEQAAHTSRRQREQLGRYRRPIVTEIVPADPFYPAEDYHQRYYEKQGRFSCRR
ncbi:MAG: peptide-methionine (S)-S-oxide reductase MsrA [Thermoplasmatota archaeon]